jgi:hypothetical protein
VLVRAEHGEARPLGGAAHLLADPAVAADPGLSLLRLSLMLLSLAGLAGLADDVLAA